MYSTSYTVWILMAQNGTKKGLFTQCVHVCFDTKHASKSHNEV